MAHGLIRNPLDERLLILYILDRLILPVTMPELTDLALCDGGINYFQFTQALTGLLENGQVHRDGAERLSITEEGQHICRLCGTELPRSVRDRCDANTSALNRVLLRRSQIRATIHPIPGRTACQVELVLDDEIGNVMTLNLAAPDQEQGSILMKRFQERAEQVYQAVLNALLEDSN